MKRCKGTNSKTKGLGCGTELPYSERNGMKSYDAVYGLGKRCGCYSKWLLNTEEGQAKIRRATLKAGANRIGLEEAAKEHKENKKRDTLSAELEKTQRLVNEYIRLRDVGKPCASSRVKYQTDFDAGHVYPVKQFSAIRFDYDNIHGQSQYANRYLHGDYANYIINLPNIIGKQRADALAKRAALCKKYTKKWTRHELKEIQEETKRRIKELKKNN